LTIQIVPLRFRDAPLLDAVAAALSKILRARVAISFDGFSLEGGRDPIRNQINSTWILSRLLESHPSGDDKVLGVTEQDLYVPVLTYVFGEAELGGRAAVVSAHRFNDELYGLPAAPRKTRDRLIIESLHELGHTCGLTHCLSADCVMRASSYAEEIDFKPARFCSPCADRLRKTCG
jgi:archaemetzincin